MTFWKEFILYMNKNKGGNWYDFCISKGLSHDQTLELFYKDDDRLEATYQRMKFSNEFNGLLEE